MDFLLVRILRLGWVVGRCGCARSFRGAARVARGIMAAFRWVWKMTKFGKYAIAGATLAAPALCLADDTSPLDSALTQLQTGVTGMISSVAPVVVAIVVALLALVGIFFAWKYVRKAIGR